MTEAAAVLAAAHAVAQGRDPLCGHRLRSGEAVLLFSRVARRAVDHGWTHRDIALASGLPVACVQALADCDPEHS